jgi:hypothetical protein
MVSNKVSYEITQEQIQAIATAVETINNALPFLVTLTPRDRRTILRAGDRDQAFIRRSLQVANVVEQHLPRSFEIDEMRRDIDLAEAIYPIMIDISQLAQKLSDTHVVLNSEAYSAALEVYSTTRRVKDLEGLAGPFAELKRRFVRRRGANGAEESEDSVTDDDTVVANDDTDQPQIDSPAA